MLFRVSILISLLLALLLNTSLSFTLPCIICLVFYNFNIFESLLDSKQVAAVAIFGASILATHRVGRGLSFFSSRRNRNSPNLSPAGECAPPRGGWAGAQSDEGTYTLVLFIHTYLVLPPILSLARRPSTHPRPFLCNLLP